MTYYYLAYVSISTMKWLYTSIWSGYNFSFHCLSSTEKYIVYIYNVLQSVKAFLCFSYKLKSLLKKLLKTPLQSTSINLDLYFDPDAQIFILY